MIHIIGANGYIGTNLRRFLDQKKIKYLCYSDIQDDICIKFDLRYSNYDDYNFNEDDVVILLAAISSPDVCQNNFDLAYEINVIATSKLIDYCINKKINVIFMSSDTVNGETIGINDEFSEVKPYGKYAQMKYEIETKYKNSKYFKVLRLSYVLSTSDKFTLYLKKCIDNNETAEVFDGMFRSVIKLETVLEAITMLACNFNFNDYYLINVSGNQNLSRVDLAEWYKNNIDSRLKYIEVPVPDFIYKSRPNVINTKSLFLEKLLKHKIENIL